MTWGHLFFGFSGRVNRAKQWLFFALLFIPGLAYEYAVISYLGLNWMEFGRMASFQDLQQPSSGKVLMLMIPFWLITAVPGLAVGVKRLHDRNRTGWWIILFLYAPWALSIFQLAVLPRIIPGAGLPRAVATMLFALAVFGLELWGFIELYCLRGTIGQNRFGPDPLGSPAEDVFE